MQWKQLHGCSLGFDPKNDPLYSSGVTDTTLLLSEISQLGFKL